MKRGKYCYLAAALASGVLIASGCGGRSYEPIALKSAASETKTVNDGAAGVLASAVSLGTASIMAAEETAAEATAAETWAGGSVAVGTITVEAAFEERSELVYVTGTGVNIRETASTSGAIIGTAGMGDSFIITGYSEEWSRMEQGGAVCFIASRFVSTIPPETQGIQTPSPSSADEVRLDSAWKYAGFSKINTGTAMLCRSAAENRKGITVCVNAGHGTQGGSAVVTQCHPDGSPKVTGGTTGAGAVSAAAVSGVMTFSDGTPEARVTLAMARILKAKLLANGYDVLMIREDEDIQLDNVARTVIANNRSDCHVALHWDSTASDKGAFFMSVPNVASYRAMEPVASVWQKHNALGESLISGLRGEGVKIWSGGSMEMDLTQTSYSTVPSVDIELGDKTSDYSESSLHKLGDGLVSGINQYFGN